MRYRLFLAAGAWLLAPVSLLTALQADDSSSCIIGSVANSLTGEPVARAAVVLPDAATLTDAAGRFRFCDLAASDYYVQVEKPGFRAEAIRIQVGSSRNDIVVRLAPLAVIHGKVTRGDGQPVQRALIQALSISIINGRRRVKVDAEAATDDRGEYRLPKLSAGRYLIRAAGWKGGTGMYLGNITPAPYSNQAFAPVYLGGASDLASAVPVTMEAGGVRHADFSITLEPAFTIRGAITNYTPFHNARIELRHGDDALGTPEVMLHAATGAFQISRVRSGNYVVRVTQGEEDNRLYAEENVQVSGADRDGVILALAGGARVRGTVHRAESAAPACSIGLLEDVMTAGADADLITRAVGGEFEISPVPPGIYDVHIGCKDYISSAHAGDIDLLAGSKLRITSGVDPPPIDIVLGAGSGTIDVTLSGEQEPATGSLLLFPESGTELHSKLVAGRGHLHVTGVAPGDYQVYAWANSEEFEFTNAEARRLWSKRATRLHVDPNGQHRITVQIPAGGGR